MPYAVLHRRWVTAPDRCTDAEADAGSRVRATSIHSRRRRHDRALNVHIETRCRVQPLSNFLYVLSQGKAISSGAGGWFFVAGEKKKSPARLHRSCALRLMLRSG